MDDPQTPADEPLKDDAVLGELRECGAEVVADIIATFLGYVPERLDAIRAALAVGDRATIAAQAHGFKGACAGVGARRMAAAARALEGAARSGDDAELAAAVERFAEVWEATRAAYQAEV